MASHSVSLAHFADSASFGFAMESPSPQVCWMPPSAQLSRMCLTVQIVRPKRHQGQKSGFFSVRTEWDTCRWACDDSHRLHQARLLVPAGNPLLSYLVLRLLLGQVWPDIASARGFHV